MELIRSLKDDFYRVFGEGEEIRIFFAPGRVNMIGEHIDYNGGYVFPCALSFGTYAIARRSKDSIVKMYSNNFQDLGIVQFSIEDLKYEEEHDWANYPKGVIEVFKDNGWNIENGMDILFYGNLPNGAGLSSSASIELAAAVMLKGLFNLDVDMISMVKMCQRAENQFIGVNCGIMDQFAIGVGRKDMGILLDCSSLNYKYANLALKDAAIVIANTNKKRGLADSKYNERRRECDRALCELQRKLSISSLVELTVEEFEENKYLITNEVGLKRVRHAIYENQRTIRAFTLLEKGDIKEFGRLMNDSHKSLRDDYEVTGKELDTLVELAWQEEGTIGSRMTGAGFGGCTVSIVEKSKVDDFIEKVGKGYAKKIGYEAEFYTASVGDGAREIIEINMVNIYREIERLIAYALNKGLIDELDIIYSRNRVLEVLGLRDFIKEHIEKEEMDSPVGILNNILNWAYENRKLEHNTSVYRDLLDTKIMDCFMPRPSEVVEKFYEEYEKSPKEATGYYYTLSKSSNYIRTDRIAKNIEWKANTEYGELDITINMSKPEKDPKAIAAAKNLKSTFYPNCLLCKENEGYSGRVNHPSRQNHRILPVILKNEKWFLQYSPYVYYNEHCIVFKGEHEPMKLSKNTFDRLLEFAEKFPHYFIGSNADLPIVGGSILSHDHFQGGNYEFTMAKALIEKEIHLYKYPNIKAGIVKWPMSVIRLQGEDRYELAELAEWVLQSWREYSDKEVEILSHTDEISHNTITPIARRRGNLFELDLVLRNNRTSDEHPMGIFHPHGEVHHIKKENIGLIEVMGLAVLPDRLKVELEKIAKSLINKEGNVEEDEDLMKHLHWITFLKSKYQNINENNVEEILQTEVGVKFATVLEHAGVFKRNEKGQKAFMKFIRYLNL